MYEWIKKGTNETGDINKEREKVTPLRLRLAIKALVEMSTKKVEVIGKDNLNKIPNGKKVIIAASHCSDLDVNIIFSELANNFDIAITNQSIHHEFGKELSTNIGLMAAGKDNFLPIKVEKVKNKNGKEVKKSYFNPDDFPLMEKKMDEGKTILMAAHNPSDNGELARGGYGIPYLSSLNKDDVVILPVAVNLKSAEGVGMHNDFTKTMANRPEAEVIIGKPFQLEKIKGIENAPIIMKKGKHGEGKRTGEEVKEFNELADKLREQSNRMMEKIADLLPEEKRGIYKTINS